MQSEMKPCPFCGCEKILNGYIRDGREIVCGECRASVVAFHPGASKRAAERWNRRAEAALSAAEQQTAPSVAGEIADAVLSWMVEYDLLDAGNEYRAAEVIAVLDDFKPSYHAALSAQVQDVAKLDADEIAAAISTAACELGDVPDPEGDDTISITVRDLEAIAHRHITVAIDRAATPAKQEG